MFFHPSPYSGVSEFFLGGRLVSGGGKIIINSYVLLKILLGVFSMFLGDPIDEISRAGAPCVPTVYVQSLSSFSKC